MLILISLAIATITVEAFALMVLLLAFFGMPILINSGTIGFTVVSIIKMTEYRNLMERYSNNLLVGTPVK